MKKFRRLTAFCLAGLLLLSTLPSAALADDAHLPTASAHSVDWAGTYTGEYNNSVTTAPIPYTGAQLVKLWDAAVGEGAIAIVDGYIYTYNGVSGGGVTAGGILYKVDKNTGEIVQSLDIGEETGYYYSYTFYGDGCLYISCPAAIMCVDIDTFSLKWRTKRTEVPHCSAQLINGYIVANGLIFDAATGAQLMDGNKPAVLDGSYDWANGAEVGGYFYIASNSTLYAYDTTTWKLADELDFTGGRGSGVMYHNGRVFWGAGSKVYCVKVNDGVIDDDSCLSYSWGYTVVAPPVALDSRVYFVGNTTDGDNGTGTAAIGVFNAASLELVYNGMLDGAGHKLQTVPILRSVTSGGAELAGDQILPAGVDTANAPQTKTAYIFVQDYKNPSSIYVMSDTVEKTSGTSEKLFEIDPAQFAFEQMACDKQGNLYCINDSGYLVKYGKPQVSVPTFSKNLSTEEVFYNLGETLGRDDRLSVMATKSGDGTLTYQWQSHNGNGVFANISGATGSSYTPSTSVAGTTYYRCVVTNTLSGVSAKAYSNIAKITVRSSRGDINGDGVIDRDDVNALRRYLAGKAVDVVTANSDINGNGKIGLIDLVKLRQYVEWGFGI